eukprot:CAMPEP_0197280552 /NCGR_PEP_ID=MMETSP1432-20130617/21655_1 /TAXON_ID=44447 /ORGANISM="Pseudo-nitzschia delicatissima, Strain UNC1205" /LENGTH=142 /DNA_ID=CAMNT_0042747263 /DNA_START=283 /DNA_END=712 /DNA_ORIENTATION=-
MTLFDDSGTQLEEIKLYELKTREEMHTLMIEKGFSKKTKSQKVADIQLEKMERRIGSSPGTGTLSALNFVIFGVLAALVYATFARKRRKKAIATARADDISSTVGMQCFDLQIFGEEQKTRQKVGRNDDALTGSVNTWLCVS